MQATSICELEDAWLSRPVGLNKTIDKLFHPFLVKLAIFCFTISSGVFTVCTKFTLYFAAFRFHETPGNH